MADRLPPSRYSVVERGGRLVVIDRETGLTPLSAAERMDLYDRKMGIEPMRPVAREPAPEAAPAAKTPPTRTPPPTARPGNRMEAAVAAMNRKQPWEDKPKAAAAPPPPRIPARSPSSTAAAAGGRKTIVTGKWWDAKGPRTIELGEKGQQALTGGFVTIAVVFIIASIVALFNAPVIFFVGVFLLFRFGSNILGPIGAGIIDKAIAEKG
ncbi:hypothetical protein [Sphingopyxis macrogoltabida]|uniref:Uncharacterized protein n=1 Tax=Sphingopyxis macrogoltabida TaxID=33050 RepID=A0A0N9V1W6_SPHMC|nr:hypothetical protein [Sphingopyxis macrogoltabida]ALH82751.1 hypothetical protein AN936_21010 [Sphingopyxis macrogoltabida]